MVLLAEVVDALSHPDAWVDGAEEPCVLPGALQGSTT